MPKRDSISTVLFEADIKKILETIERINKRHPDAIKLYQLEDRKGYALVGKDATDLTFVINIAPGSVHMGNGLGWVRYITFESGKLDIILPKIVRAGHRVCILENIEDAKLNPKKITRNAIRPEN